MNLAFCLFTYFPYGGLQRDFLRIARECKIRGHDIHVYTMHWEGELEPGFKLHLIKAKGWQNHTRIHSFVQQLRSQLKAAAHDLVIGFNKMPHLDLYYAADVCYAERARTQRSYLYRCLPRYQRFKHLEKTVFARGHQTHILLISSAQQAAFVQHYQTEAARFHLLPPGIAKDRKAPLNAADIRTAVRATLKVEPTHQLILMVGSGFKTKGVDRALLAFAALPSALKEKAHLFVVGQDDPKNYIALARQYQIAAQVHFLGGRSDVPDLLLAADLLLHPAYHENTGTVLLEAMVAGLPVLTVDVCGYAPYIQEAKAGVVLASPFQQTTLNTNLANMLSSTKQQTWKQHALQFAEHANIYNMPQIAADLIEKKATEKDIWNIEQMMALRGDTFRHQDGRMTQRVTLGEQSYFIKQHQGVGWKEIFKNILQARLPIWSAKNEWRAIQKLQTLGIAVAPLIAFGQKGYNPARLQSYILMGELAPVISLEDLVKTWKNTPPSFAFKRQLIIEVARIARLMHQHGVNHRDFYLCHFLLDTKQGLDQIQHHPIHLSLIDLHRAQIRRVVPLRWIIKDLSALFFSCANVALTQRDLLRFIKAYDAKSLRTSDFSFWKKVKKRAQSYRDHTQS